MSKFSEQREETAAAVRRGPRWIWIGGVFVVLAIAWAGYYFLYYRKPLSTLDSFAQCLTSKGTKMYGAWWCPHCKDQKESFGFALQYVNYVERSEERRVGKECRSRWSPY